MVTSKRKRELHDEALKAFDAIQSAVSDERRQCLEDRRFYSIAGAQWEGDLEEQYENKPKFEVNKIHLSVIRIFSEYRNNRVSVDFTPRKAEDEKLAELCDGLFRADENDSEAREAYDNAFEEAVGGGYAAWRLRAEYEDEYDEDNDNQRIRIEPIYDADTSVFFDLDSRRQDKSDAKFCFVVTAMQKDSYMEEFGDDPTTWPKDTYDYDYDWSDKELVYVAEYYKVEDKNRTMVYFESITGEEEKHWLDEITDEMLEEFAAIETTESSRRKVRQRRVHKYILSGGGVLEDCGYIAGKEIPIVPVFGKRWMVNSIERCMGHVRLAKDAQRLKNMQLSKLGEISALSSVEKPIFTPEQMDGHQLMWSEDNIKDFPYLLVNPITNEEGQVVSQGPIGYTKPSAIPPAMAALLQITEEDMRDILGNAQAGEEMDTNISGKAVELIQNRLDMQTFIYLSNFSKGMKRCGEIWLSMAKDLYIEDEREMKTMSAEEKATTKKIMVRKPDENGDIIIENNLSEATFDVNVDVGPSSSSKRAATVRAVTGMMGVTQDPETLQVLNATAMMNMEGEGISEVREFFRKKLVSMGATEPTEEDMAEMQQQPDQPSPQDTFALAEAQRAEAEAAKYRADTVETIANAELKKAQAAKIQADMMAAGQPQAPEAPMAPNLDQERLMLDAQKTNRELELKEKELGFKRVDYELKQQELALKEQEQALRLAEAAISAEGNEKAEAAVQKSKDAMSDKMLQVVESLEQTMRAQAANQKAAVESLSKPKTVVRKDGKIVGIE